MTLKIEREKPKPAPLMPIKEVTAIDCRRSLYCNALSVVPVREQGKGAIAFTMTTDHNTANMLRVLSNADAIELAFAILEMTGVRDMCAKRCYDKGTGK